MKTAKQLLETYLAAISAGEMEKAIAYSRTMAELNFRISGLSTFRPAIKGWRP